MKTDTLKTKQRNNSIDYFRYYCALLIVVIHEHPFSCISQQADRISIDYFTRIGVPFFFIVSGYYFTKKLCDGKHPLKAMVIKTLKTYLVWSEIYAIVKLFYSIVQHKFSEKTVVEILLGFLYKGTSEHLWFIPSLIVALTVLTLVYKFNLKKVLYIYSIVAFSVACLGFSYYNVIGRNIPVLNALYDSPHFTYIHRLFIFGICFVTLGSMVYVYEKKFTNKSNLTCGIMIAVCYALFVAEKIAVAQFKFGTNNLYNFALYPLVLVIFIFLLKNPMSDAKLPSIYFRNSSSFIYYSHPFFMIFIGEVIHQQLIIYLIICIIATVIPCLITKYNLKKLEIFI